MKSKDAVWSRRDHDDGPADRGAREGKDERGRALVLPRRDRPTRIEDEGAPLREIEEPRKQGCLEPSTTFTGGVRRRRDLDRAYFREKAGNDGTERSRVGTRRSHRVERRRLKKAYAERPRDGARPLVFASADEDDRRAT